MAGVMTSLSSLLAAGVLLFSGTVKTAAPQRDIEGTLYLVNRAHRVSQYFVPELRIANVEGQLRNMNPDAAAALERMFADCKAQTKVVLKAVSGYRSYTKQSNLYSNKLKAVKNNYARADEYVARPGASEHQLGMAMDVGQKNKVSLTAGFGSTKGGKWVRAHCHEYGFIIRYEQGWEDITGYKFEPWHVRYVGPELSRQIHDKNVPLETFLIEYRTELLLSLLTEED